MRTSACEIIAALSELRLNSVPYETDIHAVIAGTLHEHGIPFEHEARIAPRLRVDFLCGGDMSVVIEVKKGKPDRAKLIGQISKYLECAEVAELIVVTQRHISIPDRLNNKAVHQLAVDRLWGIALP